MELFNYRIHPWCNWPTCPGRWKPFFPFLSGDNVSRVVAFSDPMESTTDSSIWTHIFTGSFSSSGSDVSREWWARSLSSPGSSWSQSGSFRSPRLLWRSLLGLFHKTWIAGAGLPLRSVSIHSMPSAISDLFFCWTLCTCVAFRSSSHLSPQPSLSEWSSWKQDVLSYFRVDVADQMACL